MTDNTEYLHNSITSTKKVLKDIFEQVHIAVFPIEFFLDFIDKDVLMNALANPDILNDYWETISVLNDYRYVLSENECHIVLSPSKVYLDNYLQGIDQDLVIAHVKCETEKQVKPIKKQHRKHSF